MNIVVHPRVLQKRPWLTVDDIYRAVQNPIAQRTRSTTPMVVAGIGYDMGLREIEWLAAVDDNDWLVYHAQDNPTTKFRIEVNLL